MLCTLCSNMPIFLYRSARESRIHCVNIKTDIAGRVTNNFVNARNHVFQSHAVEVIDINLCYTLLNPPNKLKVTKQLIWLKLNLPIIQSIRIQGSSKSYLNCLVRVNQAFLNGSTETRSVRILVLFSKIRIPCV